ncbi:MAG TPA: hypothetical protein DEA08_30145 [Planctomycetes bacterium]|nr:hypothetical protein [Planctomycetota bacterium]|tara:strand:+ start:111 stop:356 length:246 start_codon:yes stop_codon:yes gene_type:complete
MAIALTAVLYFLLATEMAWRWKAFACALFGAAVTLQFNLVEHQLPIAVPTLLHVFLGIWFIFYLHVGDACFAPIKPGRIQR